MVVGLQSIAVMNGGSETWLDGRRSRWLVGWLVCLLLWFLLLFLLLLRERRERGGGERERKRGELDDEGWMGVGNECCY